jgi:NAD(P)-dependent dehydrogenase (short-subunit alcohol dehydrogenase family)
MTSPRLIALVTGAAKGIGHAVSIKLAKAGYDIAALDLSFAGLEDTRQAVAAAGGESLLIEADVANEKAWITALAEIEAWRGRLDLLVNNAGIAGPIVRLAKVSVEDFDRVYAVNVRGVFLGMKHCTPHLEKTKGAIVNVGSISGLTGGANTIAYTASKHAVTGMTMLAANELAARGVRVNAVCPAPTATDMIKALELRYKPEDPAEFHREFAKFIPMGRYGEPNEIADAIVYLASPQAAFITGVALPVDGGATAR